MTSDTRQPSVEVDVLIVGLGPAGASAAAEAARAGATVLAIDRKQSAGVPVQCAEFVPALIGQATDVFGGAAVQPITSMTTFVLPDTERHDEPHFSGHMIDRAQFDAALVREAEARGADCRFGIVLRDIDAEGCAVLSDGARVRARVIIGADGPRSVVGKLVGRENEDVSESRQITVPLLQPFQATDIFLSPEFPGGYAWLFPKGGVANLGMGVAQSERHRLKPLLEALHGQLAREGRVGSEILTHTGGAIPAGGMVEPAVTMGKVTVLLAGDAAGLANPITGAGINPAVQSGTLAGAAAARLSRGDATAAEGYREDLDDLFGVSLARAVKRRRDLLATFATGVPRGTDLKRGWIAFPAYWAA